MTGLIVVIDDDNDDLEFIQMALEANGVTDNLIFFNNSTDALKYREQEEVVPFMIFSDINMPGISGFQLRDKIHANPGLRVKCVPLLFLTTGDAPHYIWEAAKMPGATHV